MARRAAEEVTRAVTPPPAFHPNTLGWEKAVIGTALYDPQTMEVAAELVPGDFSGCHQFIFAEMLALFRRGALDVRALVEALRERNRLDDVGDFEDPGLRGEVYINALLACRGAAMQEYVERVKDASTKRELQKAAYLIVADALNERISGQEAADRAERRLLQLRRYGLSEGGVYLGELVGAFITRVQGLMSGEIQPAWVPEIAALQKKIKYVDRDDFVICAARPGEGKSSIMRYSFGRAALAQSPEPGRLPSPPTPTLIVNLENSASEYAKFMIAMLTGLDSDLLKDPRTMLPEQFEMVIDAAKRLERSPLIIKTLGAASADDIERVLRYHLSRDGIKRLGVDYIQLMRNGSEKKVEDVSVSSQRLRAMALNYGLPVMANAQLSRNIEHRGDDAEPRLSDLRDSGSLEQDATMVWVPRLLWPAPSEGQLRMFPENVDTNGRLHGDIKAIPVRIHVLKNRNGSIGVTEPVLWLKALNLYRPLALRP